jgi:hypothetical protein
MTLQCERPVTSSAARDMEPAMTRLPCGSVEQDRSSRRTSPGVVLQVQYEIGPAGLDRRLPATGRRRPDVPGPSDRIDESGVSRLGDLDRF